MAKNTFVQGSLFEEDYLVRTLGELVHKPDVAITELVANAWDAGASNVKITIPEKIDQKLIIEDDGVGLSPEEFHDKWMCLGYNRLIHQGNKVEFPESKTGTRLAYGRNGVGRHGLLCFNNHYQMSTCKKGKQSIFKVTTSNTTQPFVLQSENVTDIKDKTKHGTCLEVLVQKHLPKSERILELISARFLHDPEFIVSVNDQSVPLEEHIGLIDSSFLNINQDIKLEILFIDTQKAARSTLYQGIAFWQGGRLVGEPSWILGRDSALDGRTRFAKQYTFVVKTNDLAHYVNKDWTGFIKHHTMDELYDKLMKYTQGVLRTLAQNQIDQTKIEIKNDFKEQYAELSALGKFEVNEVIEHVVDINPTSNQETLGIAVEAVINLEKTRSGKELLQKLSNFSDDDIAGLNRLLDQWTTKDALSVLDEIDRRISVIEAINKLSGDSSIDELKILHPLVTDARWLFGPEYDSAEYTSNQQLRTITKKIFGVHSEEDTFENDKKRPDLFVRGDSTISITGTQQFNNDSKLLELNRILIVELKRGGSSITRDNRTQALNYVEDIMKAEELPSSSLIYAYVVGETISGKLIGKHTVGENGNVFIATFSQLVDTARRRLFNLQEKLTERYQDIPGVELAEKIIQPELDIT